MIYASSEIRKQIYSDPWDKCYWQLLCSVHVLRVDESREILQEFLQLSVWIPLVSEVNRHMASEENIYL